jgi:hypothetical protein
MKARMFNQNVVRYIMNGTQTQDRRLLKVQPRGELVCQQDTLGYPASEGLQWYGFGNPKDPVFYKPRHKVGDIIGVRERARRVGVFSWRYEVDGVLNNYLKFPDQLKPIPVGNCVPNGCFKELIRTFLKVTAVRLERFCDISLDDIISEGVEYDSKQGRGHLREKFRELIESIYPGQWNSWCEVTEFELTDKP